MGQTIRMFSTLLLGVLFALSAPPAAPDDFAPVPADELSLKDSPTHPGAHALVLYREEYTDDVESNIRHHVRIKILTEEGKKYANVELPFVKQLFRVSDIKARTVRPDGTAIPFKGEVFEKTVVKARGIKVVAKSFSLPDVQVGAIVEYKYKEQFDVHRFPRLRWSIQEELPTRRALFQRRYYPEMALRWMSIRLPNNRNAEKGKGSTIRLELENIPPFEEEEYMPPREELNMRVDFYYVREVEDQEAFWKGVGKRRFQQAEQFIGKHGDIAREAISVTSPGDPPETKLRKLYARAQQIRNLSFERDKTEKEEKREKLKDNSNVKDVLKNGYGYGWEINCLFVALVRAAGLDASVADLAGRHEYFFNPGILDDDQLNAYVTLVRLGGQDVFLDPASKFSPYGLLSWAQTGVRGLKLTKDGGVFVNSPNPQSAAAIVERNADLKLLDDGTLEGTLRVVFHGQSALDRRSSAHEEDATGRRKEIEDEIKGWLPASANIEIKNTPNWDGPEEPLRVESTLRIPGYAAATGRRLLLPGAVFHSNRKHPFQHTKRIHPIYFAYPFQEVDRVTISLPPGYQVEGLPAPKQETAAFGAFQAVSKAEGATLRLERRFVMEGLLFRTEYYNMLRSFYDRVRSADEERVVLRTSETARD